ncbi:MAG: hypothetical protein GY799_21065 [Desulfobulbaceae bacterium]|nr:hypothetical protein [Desulfobulbaceae bacterium]
MQKITSAKTSINQVPALFKKPFMANHTNGKGLDYGGGKYNKGVDYLKAAHGITSRVYDPFNRSDSYNAAVMAYASHTTLDFISCCNVLNVIDNEESISKVLIDLWAIADRNTTIYIQIYEGDKKGQGKSTTKGYQRNRKAYLYQGLIEEIFECWNIKRKNNTFILKRC